MKKAAIVLTIYLLSLLIFSLIQNYFKLNDAFLTDGRIKAFSPMMLATIVGGLISLYITLPKSSFKIFIIVYSCLWVIRLVMLTLATNIGEVEIFNRPFRFDLIIPNYYENVSRLGTPLPFVIFWFINYLFLARPTAINNNASNKVI
jgi:hypothetical protein